MLASVRRHRARHSLIDGLRHERHRRYLCHRATPWSTIRRLAATTVPSLRAPAQSGPAKKDSCNPVRALGVSEKNAGLARLHSRGVAALTNFVGPPHATSRSVWQFPTRCNEVVRD